MSSPGSNQLLPHVGSLSLVLGLAWLLTALLAREAWPRHQFRRYSAHLDRLLRLLFLPGSGRQIALVQLAALGACIAAGVALSQPACYGLGLVVLAAPVVHLGRARKQHVAKLEAQIDGLIVGLANALKSVPSPAAALGHLVSVLPSPMRLEIDRMLGDIRVGSTLEQGLISMSARLGSPDVSSALSALLIGLQVGGNLPQVLENTAATIREMNRLEGVVRTKTSEARAQLWVLALFPFVIAIGFHLIDRQYFSSLRSGALGALVLTVAGSLWAASLALARKILKVDI